MSPPRRFPSIWHLICVAIIALLWFSNHVSLQNGVVVVLSTLYLLLLSNFSFPPPPKPDETPIFPSSKLLPLYVLFAGLLGLLLPLLYILHGLHVGDRDRVSAAAPHLFLLSSQVLMEGVTFAARFSIPVRAFVPVFYNSWRIQAVVQWARATQRPGFHSQETLYFGKGLAWVNVAFWSFNLFGFLLPVYLPKAFKRYYSPTTNAAPTKLH